MPGTRLPALAVLLAAVAYAGVAAAQPLGTAFTYQGRLTDAGNPANGSYDFRFTLYDAPTGGAAVGAPVTANGVAVAVVSTAVVSVEVVVVLASSLLEHAAIDSVRPLASNSAENNLSFMDFSCASSPRRLANGA